MRVKELIKRLKQTNQDLEVYMYFNDDIHELHSVDDSIEDRIDINVEVTNG
jgi:hypothetical protein